MCRIGELWHCTQYCALFCDPNPFYGWAHSPGAWGRCQSCPGGRKLEWSTHGRYDAHGLRNDRDIPYEHGSRFRILVLGDSFTEGLQVDEPYPTLLEKRLDSPGGAGAPVEVLNAAVAGWGTDNSLLYFLHDGWKYHPDLVLLAFNTLNDVFENHHGLMQTTTFYPDKPYFELVEGGLALRHYPLRVEGWRVWMKRRVAAILAGHSALYRFVSALPFDRLRGVARADPGPSEAVVPLNQNYVADTTPRWREGWRTTRGLVLKLRAAVEARGARFAVVVVHGRDEVCARWRPLLNMTDPAFRVAAQDFDKPDRLATEFLRRRDIPFYSLLGDFRAAFGKDGTPGFWGFDVHWAPAGHELAARIIAHWLLERGLVPRPPPS